LKVGAWFDTISVMSKPRTCPYCRATLGIVDGFTFDSSLNLKCGACGKVVFPAAHSTEAVAKGVPKPEQFPDFSVMPVDDYT